MKKILIAEDNRVNLQMLTFILKKSGYLVVPAMDGQEALDQLTEQTVDLLIADIDMPNMDGIECIEALSALREVWMSVVLL